MPYIGRGSDFGVRSVFHFLASNGDTSVSGADADGKNLNFTDGNFIDVYLNGVRLKSGEDYNTATANTVAGLSALNANDEVNIVVYDTFTVADTVKASTGGTFSGGITISTDLNVGDDVSLTSDSAVLSFGTDSEIKVTHVADTGLKLTDDGGTPTLQLHDANESVSSDGSKLILTSNGVAFSLPTADGTSNQVLQTNGSGVLSFATVDTSGATDSFAITGSTPTLTIGDAGAEDTKIVFDGNAQDYHIGLDDTDDDLKIGKGSALGTTTWMSFDENGVIYVKSDGGNVTTEVTQGLAKMWIQFNGTGTIATNDSLNTSSVTDNATGHYQININNDMSNDDFSVANALSRVDGSGSGQLMALPGTSTGAGIVAMYNQNTSATNIDTTQVYAVVHGDLA